MQRKFNFIYLISGCWLFCSLTPIFTLNSVAEESLRLDLTQELKKGNFLIGLKQYLGTKSCLLYTSPSPRDLSTSRMPSSA